MNFHLKDGIYFRRDGDSLRIVRATSFDDPGELLVETDVSGLASIVSSFSPNQERHGSFQYILEFLTKGTMFCAGCGCRMLPADEYKGGCLSIINAVACKTCYEQKFKPLFDWGMKGR